MTCKKRIILQSNGLKTTFWCFFFLDLGERSRQTLILYIGRVNPYYITDDITHSRTDQSGSSWTHLGSHHVESHWEDLNHGLQGRHWMVFNWGGGPGGSWVGSKVMGLHQICLVLPLGNIRMI